MAIGNYIHYNYKNYLKYGLSKKDENERITESSVMELFQKQRKNMLNQVKEREEEKRINTKELEKQLNYYYKAQQQQDYGNISEEDLKDMHKAVELYLGKKLEGIKIDYDTLSTSSKTKNFNQDILQLKGAYEKSLEEELKSYSKNSLNSNGQQINKKTIERRMNTLLKLREELEKDKNTSDVLIKKMKALEQEWKYIQELLNSHKVMSKNRILLRKENSRANNFIHDLDECISSFLKGTSTMHGEYAEAIISATNYVLNANAKKGVDNILSHLSKNVIGDKTSKKGLKSDFFDSEFVDLQQIAIDSKKQFTDKYDNVWTVNATQDKVDVIVDIEGISIPTSVKNYDMSNQFFTDIHLLSGRSIIKLVQEYEIFTNHYLNIMAQHPDEEASNQLRFEAQQTMKATVLSKALIGGIINETGVSNKADLFIINDNSTGQFKVYLMSSILNTVFNNFSLLKTGDLDNFVAFDNAYVNSSAKARITNLISQLHRMELKVSIDKQVFKMIE